MFDRIGNPDFEKIENSLQISFRYLIFIGRAGLNSGAGSAELKLFVPWG